MKKWTIPILFCVISLASLGSAAAQTLDISSGGAPSISGSLNGSITGSSSVLNNLSVTINFGELSPANTNSIVKVNIPITVRSNQAYKVTASVTGSTNANAQAIQRTDIGFGLRNFRAMGSSSRVCALPHIFYPPFDNDPATTFSINAAGRVAYPSSLGSMTGATTILSGPRLSNGGASRATDDGYIFDAILAITPQFFAPGSTTATITFTISSGPAAPC